MKFLAGAALVLGFAIAAHAQVQPVAGTGDPHLQQVDYSPSQIVRLRSAPGFQMLIELSPDEQVESVAVGDSGAWQVSADKAGNRLFLKAIEAGNITNMTVVTSVRVYNFDLNALPGPEPDMPYTVQFHYPAPKPAVAETGYVDVAAVSRGLSRYRLSGDRSLWPASLSDDGQHIFIAWPRTAAIPAVYSLDRSGHEMLVNGMMGTDDVYVIDGAPQRLTFRIDNQVASAVRVAPRKGR